MRYFLVLLFLISGCAHIKAPERKKTHLHLSWVKNLDPSYESGNLPVSFGAPRIFNDMVFMGSLTGFMTAYDAESGRVIWQVKENAPLGAPVEFFKDQVAYGDESGRLYVRHYLTSELKYAIDLGSPIESAPVFFNDRLVIYLRGHQIVHLDAETGKVLWAYKRAVPITTTLQRTTKPLLVGNKLIVGFADGFLGALSVDEGTLLWETKLVEQSKFIDVDLNPILVNGQIISGSPSGELKSINPDSGAISQTFPVSVEAHPYAKGEQLILGANDGEVLIMGLDGQILKRAKVSKKAISAVTWWKDMIIAASFDGMIRAIDPLTMKVVDTFAMGTNDSAVFSDLVVSEDILTFYSSRNRLYIFH